MAAQAAALHLLEADDHRALRGAALHHRACDVQPRRAGRTVVVHIVDGDARHAELVEDALAACGVAIAVAGDAQVDVVIVEVGIEEGFDAGLWRWSQHEGLGESEGGRLSKPSSVYSTFPRGLRNLVSPTPRT